jgi:hypothetical protein
MAITFPTAYPAELKNAAWQKKKSFIDKAKASTKTGLGAALTKAEQEWGKIKFAALAAKPSDALSERIASESKAFAQKYHQGQVEVARKALLAAGKLASTTSHNTALSKTARAAALDLSNKMARQALRLQLIKFDDFDDAIAAGRQADAKAAKLLSGAELAQAFAKYKQTKSPDDFIALTKRFMGAQRAVEIADLDQRPELAEPLRKWKELGRLMNDHVAEIKQPDTAKRQDDVKEFLRKAEAALDNLK